MTTPFEKPILTPQEWQARLPQTDRGLYAMYSSVVDGIVTDPALMNVPVDDHMVHRGDAVFESMKCVDGNIYNLCDHLERLQRSCDAIGLKLPATPEALTAVIVQTVRAGARRDALVRLLVSRGTGTMGVDPYACLRPEYYVVVYELKRTAIDRLPDGVRVAVSRIPIKPGIFARIKTCNYLPNVLMKKEAVDLGVEFTVSLDENGNLAEGATENFGIVTRDNELLMPPPERVLAGTTARRAMVFAERLKQDGVLAEAACRPISLDAVRDAAEVHIYGTTTNITPVIVFDGKPVGSGKPGPIASRLFDMLHHEMMPASARLTQVFE